MKPSLTRRLTLLLALLLLGFGALVALVGRNVAQQQEQESLQRLSHGLARHIVEHWPEVTLPPGDAADHAARAELLKMLMVVNPGIQVYMLDADGLVDAYLGEPGMVRTPQVDLSPVRDFMAGAPLPLAGTDPMVGDSGAAKIFSAAMFPPRPGDVRPPGYLYIVLEGAARAQVAGDVGAARVWRSAAAVATLGLLVTLLLGLLLLQRLTLPLHRLAERMQAFRIDETVPATATPVTGDEVAAIATSFDAMARRIDEQAVTQHEQASAHREVIANVAHDLRTPLTALHGHLEALGGRDPALDEHRTQRHLTAALAQSEKVRRLSQQLFELATLQSTGHLLVRERFSLDELVSDAVQKFELVAERPPVRLDGPAPGRIEVDGDLQLIERALTNLIDNAIRHAPVAEPVRVSLQRDGARVNVLIEDRGPGLPAELARRLDAGHPVRDPPLQRPGGGIGGLGLAIAQRIASLHGGTLSTQVTAHGGTRLCLALPAA